MIASFLSHARQLAGTVAVHLARLLEERGVHAFTVDDGPGAGRLVFHFDNQAVRLEWALFSKSLGASLRVDPWDSDITVGLSIGASVYFTVEHNALKPLLQSLGIPKYQKRKTSIDVHSGAIWWNVWTNPDEWRSTTPRWEQGSLQVLDLLLGMHERHVTKTEGPVSVQVPMPEGPYPAEVTIETVKWGRPRWFPETLRTANVKLEKCIPFSGKGENSWDCGEDGLWEMSCRARNIGEAVGKVVGNCLETRQRRGDPWAWKKAEASTPAVEAG